MIGQNHRSGEGFAASAALAVEAETTSGVSKCRRDRHGLELAPLDTGDFMDRKTKKKLQSLNQKIQQLQKQLAGARQHHDDPEEVRALEEQLAKAEEQRAALKSSG